MDFRFGSDDLLLAASVRDFLATQCTPAHVATAWGQGPDRRRWSALAELGLVGMLAPEAVGGLGLDEVALTLPLEEAGWAGLPEPLLEVAAVAVPLLVAAGGGEADELLRGICAGSLLAVPALEVDPFPAHVQGADHVLVQHGEALRLVQAGEVASTPQPNLDGARPTASVVTDGEVGRLLAGSASEALAMARARGAWASAAMLAGVGRRLVDLATEHALQREQFGRPIGSFQAVKHHLASALVALEFARPLVHRAAWSIARRDDDLALHASMAKARAGEAAEAAALAALQVHGAIGYTWEHPLHLFMKRAWSLTASWGTTEAHWQFMEAELLG